MALGSEEVAQPLFISTVDLPGITPNPFYEAVNKVPSAH